MENDHQYYLLRYTVSHGLAGMLSSILEAHEDPEQRLYQSVSIPELKICGTGLPPDSGDFRGDLAKNDL